MRRSPLPIAKYVIGFSVAFIAVSNCLSARSSSSSLTAIPVNVEAAKPHQHLPSLGLLAPTNSDLSRLESNREEALLSRAGLSIRASAISPFAPGITATKSHTPSGNASPGDTITYTVVISNSTGTADATGVMFDDTIDANTTFVNGSINVSPIAVNDTYNTIGNVDISVPASPNGLLSNDLNPGGMGTLDFTQINGSAFVSGSPVATTHGSVTVNTDGSFTYNPAAGFAGPSDSFTYTLGNGTGMTDTATVTINISGRIWFVNSALGSNGDGRRSSPFNILTGAGSADSVDGANDAVFLFSSATNYTGGLTLTSGEMVIGEGASQSILTITGFTAPSGTNLLPSTGGSSPMITSSGVGVGLGTNNEIWGVTFGNTTGASISGTSFGTLKVRDTAKTGNGQALNLSTGTLDTIFQSISSTSSASTGMTLNATSGSFSVTGTTSVTNSGGAGVNLTSNTGTITFAALNITNTTSNQTGLNATENTNTITTTSGAINTGSGGAVNITKSSTTTPLAITLTSVSSSGGSADGIILSNTSGSFTINGDGTNTTQGGNSSGGTIANKTGADGSSTQGTGVFLNNVTNITLLRMHLNDFQNDAIHGNSVNTLTIKYTTVTATSPAFNGNTTAQIGNFHGEGDVQIVDLVGSALIDNNSFDRADYNTFAVFNASSSDVLNRLVMTNNTVGVNGTADGNIGVALQSQGGTMNVTFNDNAITGAGANTFVMDMHGVATCDLIMHNNAISNNHPNIVTGGGGVSLQSGGVGDQVTFTFDVDTNTFRDAHGAGFNIGTGVGHNGQNFSGNFNNNSIGVQGAANSGSTTGNDLFVQLRGATANINVTNNRLYQYNPNGTGAMQLEVGDVAGHVSAAKFVVTGNTISNPGTTVNTFNGIQLNSGPTSTDVSNTCLTLHSNSVTGAGGNGGTDIRLRQRAQTNVALVGNGVGYGGAVNDTTAVNNFATAQNGGTPTASSQVTNSPPHGFFGSCSAVGLSAPITVTAESFSGTTGSDDGKTDVLQTTYGEGPGGTELQKLTPAELAWMVQAALARWRQAGVSATDMSRLEAVTFDVENLPDGQLASASTSHIKIDETGAGYGWFFDQTPKEDSEFDVAVPNRELQTTEYSPAHGKMDLLTVLMRELGVIYLQGKDHVSKSERKKLQPLMESTLSPSVRRLPDLAQAQMPSPQSEVQSAPQPAAGSVASSPASSSSARGGRNTAHVSSIVSAQSSSFPLSLGTIPIGKQVTITFQVTINNPLPNGVCSVTNQGQVTGTNFSQVDTNTDVTPINKALTISACPANITASTDAGACTAVVTYTTPTADGCPAPTVTCTPPSGSTFAKGTTTVTCTASNGANPDQSCSFTVTVNDNEPPTVTCPSPITANTDPGQCSAVVTYTTPTGHDNCPGVTVNCAPASGSTFNKGVTTVTCTATDAASLTGTCSFTVTIVDNQSPTIGACPAPITTNTAPGMCSAVVTYSTPTASDNCPGVTVGCSPPSGSSFGKGVTTVTCTATDTSSHTASCSFTVTVIDNQPPSITCPGNVNTTEDSPGSGCATVTYTTPTPSDNCPGATANCSPPSGTCFPIGTTTVTCTAMDTSANTSSCQFTVTVTAIGLTNLSPAKVWIGLKNSDDVGTKFDLLAEVLKNGSVVGSGQLNDVPGGSSGFNNAVLRTVTLALSSPVAMGPGDTMSFRLSVRIAATSGHNSGTARLWYNGAAIDSGASRDAGSRFDATIGGSTSDYFLRTGFVLDTAAGSSRTFVDKLVSNSGGNPFVAFGTWSKTF